MAAALAGCSVGGGSAVEAPSKPKEAPAAAASEEPSGAEGTTKRVRLDCSTQSMADFGDAFADRRNLVAGPLVLVGAAVPVSEAVVRAYGGQKFPLLVKAGQTVTVSVPRALRATVGFAYGPFPEGEITEAEAHDAITFASCREKKAGSTTADGPVTFWSGFVLTRLPQCVALDVYADGARVHRRVTLSLGDECDDRLA